MNKKVTIILFLSFSFSCNGNIPSTQIFSSTKPMIVPSVITGNNNSNTVQPETPDEEIIINPDQSLKAESISLSYDRLAITLSNNKIKNLLANVKLSDSSVENNVDWFSSDDSIATVSKYGKLTGIKEGVVIITAISKRDSNKQAKLVLLVYSDNFNPKVSSTSNKVAFISNRDGKYEVYLMNSNGSDQKKLFSSVDYIRDIGWSPKEDKLFVVSDYKINIVEPNRNNKELSIPVNGVTYASWSPDGSKLGFINHNSDSDNNQELYIVNSDGNGFKKLITGNNIGSTFNWSPDSKKISYTKGNNELRVYDLTLSKDSFITNAKYFSWLPDSSKLVFVPYLLNELPSDYDITSPIYKINSDGTNKEIFSENVGLVYSYMSLSPNMKSIAVVGSKPLTKLSYGAKKNDIYLFFDDGKHVRNITDLYSNLVPTSKVNYLGAPLWSPDSTHIAIKATSNIQANGVGFNNIITISMDNYTIKENDIFSEDNEIAWSFDSKKILYNSTKEQYENKESKKINEIYSLDIYSSQNNRLTNNNYANTKKQLSDISDKPIVINTDVTIDRSKLNSNIIFSLSKNGNTGIYLLKANTNNIIELINDPNYKSAPVFSPDGKKIAFYYFTEGINKYINVGIGIGVMNSDGTNLIKKTIPNLYQIFSFSWSPDSSKILIAGNKLIAENSTALDSRLTVISSDLTSSTDILQNISSSSYFKWTPDGLNIVFSKYNYYSEKNEMYIISSNGSFERKFFENIENINSVSWSSDGSKIIISNSDIFIANSDGSNLKKLTSSNYNNRGSYNIYPFFSPDDSKIMYMKTDSSINKINSVIAVMNPDGTNNKELTVPEDNASSGSWSQDGNFIYFTSEKNKYNDGYSDSEKSLFVMKSDGSNKTALTENFTNFFTFDLF